MRILILLETASLGGHALSALTTGKELKERGHEIVFGCGPGPLEENIRSLCPLHRLRYFYFHGNRQTYFTWRSLKTLSELWALTKQNDFDHIHAFDARSFILASMVSIEQRIPVTCTLCGGITPYYNVPKCGKLIVFSREQRDKLVNVYGWKEGNIEVISSRMDMTQFDSVENTELEQLSNKYEIDPASRNIMMITNFLGPKVESIKHVLEAIPPVLQRFSDASMVLIGGRGDFFKEAKSIGEQINRELGRKGVIFTGVIMNAQRVLRNAYIVLGVGRSAFEGMAYKKPTLIVGENGYAGTVRRNNIEEIWHYNFSGRNLRRRGPSGTLTEELARLLSDMDYYENVRYFGSKFLKQHIAINAGIEKIESVYLANANFAKERNRLFRAANMLRILIPIFIDNYYNSLKSRISSSDAKAVGLDHS